jgi:hypothetical protein
MTAPTTGGRHRAIELTLSHAANAAGSLAIFKGEVRNDTSRRSKPPRFRRNRVAGAAA